MAGGKYGAGYQVLPLGIVGRLVLGIFSLKNTAGVFISNGQYLESSPDFQMTLDKEGRIMDVNKAFEDIVSNSLTAKIKKGYP